MPLLPVKGDGALGCFVPGQVLSQCLVDEVRFGLSGTRAPIRHIIQSLLIRLAEVGGKGMDIGRTSAADFRSKWLILVDKGFGVSSPANEDLYFKWLLVAVNAHQPGDKVCDGMRVSLHESRKDGCDAMVYALLMAQFTSFL